MCVLISKVEKIYFIEEPSLPRKKQTPNCRTLEQCFDVQGLTSKSVAYHPSNAFENFRLIYFEFLDSIILVIKEKFNQPSFQAYIKMESFLPKAIDRSCTKEEHFFLHENYHGDIEVDYLGPKQEVWKTIFRDSKPTCFRDIHKTITALLSSKKLMIATFTKLCEPILVNSATSCTAERSFSTAQRLKTWLRFTMTNQRFNSLVVLNTYKTFTDKLDLCKIGNDFISKNDERYNQFGRFTEANFI